MMTVQEVTITHDGVAIVIERGALDAMTSMETAFPCFQAMLEAKGNYRPTLIDGLLAEAYDVAQAARGDGRRAFRRQRNIWREVA